MYQIDVMSRIPVYEQITSQIKRYVSLGILKEGDRLESVRSLSLKLSVNPNTIQKAYAELDAEKITISVPGRGSFISDCAKDILLQNNRNKLAKLCSEVNDLINLGISKDEINAALSKVLNKGENND